MKTTRAVRMGSKAKSGQVMLEYVVALAVFVSMIGLCALLLSAFKSYGGRVLSLVAFY